VYSVRSRRTLRFKILYLADSTHPDGVFTSDFSVNEFLLVRKAGFEPVGLCVGSCIYHLGFQFAGWGSNVELEQLSLAMYEARALAELPHEFRTDAAMMLATSLENRFTDAWEMLYCTPAPALAHRHDRR